VQNDTVVEGRRTTLVASDEWNGPLSKPVSANTDLPQNKFASRPAIEVESVILYEFSRPLRVCLRFASFLLCIWCCV
jgi:hypothetical protein